MCAYDRDFETFRLGVGGLRYWGTYTVIHSNSINTALRYFAIQ